MAQLFGKKRSIQFNFGYFSLFLKTFGPLIIHSMRHVSLLAFKCICCLQNSQYQNFMQKQISFWHNVQLINYIDMANFRNPENILCKFSLIWISKH